LILLCSGNRAFRTTSSASKLLDTTNTGSYRHAVEFAKQAVDGGEPRWPNLLDLDEASMVLEANLGAHSLDFSSDLVKLHAALARLAFPCGRPYLTGLHVREGANGPTFGHDPR
jgi:hypothetical protein